ncbi:hypothetical protein ACQ4PT_010933 [Festuca glaucescens]
MGKGRRDDRIGALPDDILVNILDRLNVPDAARTSILSTRSPGEHTIRFLSAAFYLRDDVLVSIGKAVGHTMDDLEDDERVIRGREFMRFFDACQDAFGGLTSLDMEDLRFCESDIFNILIAYKRLKHLRMTNCDSGDPSTLQIEHSHLGELSIAECSFEQVKLNWLPQLTHMTFDDWIDYQDPLVLGHVPLLEAVSLTNVGCSFHKLVKLSKFLSGTSIRVLKLVFKSERIWVQLECPTESLASV